MAKTTNKDIIQSYILTTAKYNFSIYEKRILYRIVELNQYIIEGKKLNEKYNVETSLFGDKIYTMPLSLFLKENDNSNYKEIKKAFLSLRNKIIEYETKDEWRPIGIIEKPKIAKYSSTVSFELDKLIYDVLLDFSKGFRKFELRTALEFESIYAMRFYELMSGQKTPIEYGIETLKEMFEIHNKYKLNADFFRYVIDIAQKELNEKSPYSFEYIPQKTGRKITSILFIPKYNPKNRDSLLERKDLQKQISLSWDLPKEVTDYLKHNFEFTTEGIKNNIDLFKLAHEQLDIVGFLASLKGKIRQSTNPQGYIIGALKKQLQ